MKTTWIHCQAALFLVACFVSTQSAHAGEAKPGNCSKASLAGSFGYSAVGTLLDSYVPPPYAGPFGEVGRQTFDGKGKTTASASTSSNGNISPVTIEGTYTVNADCTGTMTLNVAPFGSVVHSDFVIDDDGAEIRAIGTDSGLVETRVYHKQCRPGTPEW